MSEQKSQLKSVIEKAKPIIRSLALLLAVGAIGMALYWQLKFRMLPGIVLVFYVLMNFVFLLLLWYLLFKTDKTIWKVLGYLLAAGIIVSGLEQSQYTENEYESIEQVKAADHELGNFVELYTLDSSAIKEGSDLDNRKVGILQNMNSEDRKLMEDWIKDSGAKISLTEYDSSLEMVRNLKGAAIDAVIINQPYLEVIKGYPGLKNFDHEIRSIHQIALKDDQTADAADQNETNKDTEDKQNQNKKDSASLNQDQPEDEKGSKKESSSITDHPFTVLITGSNSYGTLKEFDNSDMNFLCTVNPKTRQIMLVRLPRDLYVQTECAKVNGCPAGQLEKLAYSGLYEIETTVKTVENIFGIQIDYYVRYNFTALSSLVNQLDGIEVDNPQEFRSKSPAYYFAKGSQTLYGERAVAYSSESRAFKKGDLARGENQLRVLKGILEKAIEPEVLEVLDTVMKSHEEDLETNLNDKDLKDLIDLEKEKSKKWSIYTYSVYGSGDHKYSPHFKDLAYVLIPDTKMIENAGRDIHAVLNGEKPIYTE